VQTLPRIEKFAKEYDIRIAIHNHGSGRQTVAFPSHYLKAVKDMDRALAAASMSDTQFVPAQTSFRPFSKPAAAV